MAEVPETFEHKLMVGRTIDGDVWVEVNWKDGRLSFMGVVGPMGNGNCRGSAGQCQDALREEMRLADGWTPEMVTSLYNLWERWHLNDMRAGSPRQMAHLRTLTYKRDRDGDHYTWAQEVLARAGLQPDAEQKGRSEDGYSYGEAWLTEEIPADVLATVYAFPVATKSFPWGRS